MEFILVVPIYILLFGGTFWIGELLMAQNMRQNSMRSAVWSHGLREDRPGGTLVQMLMMDPNVNNWTSETLPGTMNQGRYLANPEQSWTQVVGGTYNVNYVRSSWTEGWFEFARGVFNGTTWSPLPLPSAGSTRYEHQVVMRTKGGDAQTAIRKRWPVTAHLAYENDVIPVQSAVWLKVVKEAYPYDGAVNLADVGDTFNYSAPDHGDYIRFKTLFRWSNHREGGRGVAEAIKDVVGVIEDGVDGVEDLANLF
jgi:hypothetical protein